MSPELRNLFIFIISVADWHVLTGPIILFYVIFWIRGDFWLQAAATYVM